MKHKKYILFQYDQYYPSGGLGDIRGSFDTLEEAKEYAVKHRHDYNDVVDRDTWEEVWSE
jgi:hypothetical protein